MICDGMSYVSAEFMFQHYEDNNPSNIFPASLCQPQDFQGVSRAQMMRRSLSFSGVGGQFEEMQVEDDMSDDGSPLGEKKKRLNMEQVRALEKSFELGNKLEPDRKLQLARALGLQPRQVAIWFQNRRARWKTKQLERDYDILKKKFEALMADNDALQAHNKKLHAELLALKGRESNGIGRISVNEETDHQGVYQSNKHITISHASIDHYQPTSFTHILQTSSRSDIQCRKINQTVPDEGLCNMFIGTEDLPGLWPWPEQH